MVGLLDLLVHFVHATFYKSAIACHDAHHKEEGSYRDERHITIERRTLELDKVGNDAADALTGETVITEAHVVFVTACPVDLIIDVVVDEAVLLADAHLTEAADALSVCMAALTIIVVKLAFYRWHFARHAAVVPLEAVIADALSVLVAAHCKLAPIWLGGP